MAYIFLVIGLLMIAYWVKDHFFSPSSADFTKIPDHKIKHLTIQEWEMKLHSLIEDSMVLAEQTVFAEKEILIQLDETTKSFLLNFGTVSIVQGDTKIGVACINKEDKFHGVSLIRVGLSSEDRYVFYVKPFESLVYSCSFEQKEFVVSDIFDNVYDLILTIAGDDEQN